MAQQALTRQERYPRLADLADIQGLVYSGYKDHPYAAFLFATLGTGARDWLRWIAPLVTSAAARPASGRVQVALSASGLEALGVPDETLAGLPQEVQDGMAARKTVLGDDPSRWQLGGARELHALVMLYARTRDELDVMIEEHRRALAPASTHVRDPEIACRESPHEHFGFADGVSQPFLPREGRTTPESPSFQPAIAAGEILLGYPNAYAHLPKGPKLGGIELGTNGTYLVFRKLEQDVVGFWQYLAARAKELAPDDVQAKTEELAAKVMGRWRSGASLVVSPDRDDHARAGDNTFGYLERDPDGLRCPIGSHVRRANPRDARGGSAGDSETVVRAHRLLRRGRSYGAPIRHTDAIAGVDHGGTRGLYFISLQASVARGFEFVQQTWLSNPGFHGMFDEADPITGAGGSFTIPCEPLRLRLHGIPRVVTPVGGEYFFLPSISALARIAAL